ncbi:MAG: hypothetical protein ABJC74_15530 [Gemmatimonadota bacterium]
MCIRVILRLTALFGVVAAAPLTAQRPDWPLPDRTVIGDGSVINAVAAVFDRVYAAGPGGVLVLDPLNRGWTGPYFPPDPSLLSRVRAGLIDPLDRSLWLQLNDGWLRFDPLSEFWEVGRASGPVSQIAFDQDNLAAGLFLRVGASWYQVQRGSTFPTPASPPRHPTVPLTVQELLKQAPGLAGMSGGNLVDPRGRPVQYTSAAADPTGRGWWIGSSGIGLLFLPVGQVTAERVPFGLPSPSAAAVVTVPGGVWVAMDQAAGASPALAFLSSDLKTSKWNEGPMATGLPFRLASKLVVLGRDLWLGTDLGLLRIDGDGRAERYDESRGLPDQRVTAVVARGKQVLVGTAHGLVAVNASGNIVPLGTNYTDRVDAIEALGDTIWIGTMLGAQVLLPGSDRFIYPAGLDSAPPYHAPILALGLQGDTLVALNTERLEWRDPETGGWILGPLLESSFGRLHTMLPRPGGAFVAGDRAVGYVRFQTGGSARPLTVPIEIPAAPRDLAVDDEYLWVATNRGVVRWRLAAISP